MPKVGGRRKKARSHKTNEVQLEKQLPRIFVIKRGDVPAELSQTVHDLRKCFYPNTAMKLEDNNKMNIKHFMRAAKFYNVTHLVALQQNKERNYMRVIKIGAGEMLFRIMNYCRMKDVIHNGGQPFSISFKDPLVILNNFSENTQTRMIGRGLQEMFPPINPEKLKTDRLKRVVCFSYTTNKKMIYFRHYKIVVQDAGVSGSFSKLITQKSLDMSKFNSIGEYLASLNNQNQGVKGNENQQKVKLVEMGPRLKLKFLYYKEDSGQQIESYGEGEAPQLQNPEMGGGNDEEEENNE